MSTKITVHPGHELKMKHGASSLTVTNMGSNDATYTLAQHGGRAEKQTLSGPGSMQDYEQVDYPIVLDNIGADTVQIT